jgi:hypothetical protein
MGAEFIADLAKSIVELRQRFRVECLPGIDRELNERMFSARVPSRAGVDRHFNDAI